MFKKHHVSYEDKRQRYGYLFIAPWLLGVVFMFFRPLVYSIIYCFNEIQLNNGVILSPAGWKFFTEAFVKDASFLPKLTSALGNMAYQVPMILVFSLAIAYVLNSKFRGVSFFKSLFFLPVIVASGVVITIIRGDAYAQMLNSSVASSSMFKAYSIASLLFQIGLDGRIVEAILYVTSDVFNLLWKSGIQILIFISAFKSIPVTMYEASSIEGATAWESFWKVTFPMISPMLLTNIIYTIVDTFTDYSNPVIKYISEEAAKVNISYSSAMSWIYFIITFTIMITVYFLVNKRVFYYVD